MLFAKLTTEQVKELPEKIKQAQKTHWFRRLKVIDWSSKKSQ